MMEMGIAINGHATILYSQHTSIKKLVGRIGNPTYMDAVNITDLEGSDGMAYQM